MINRKYTGNNPGSYLAAEISISTESREEADKLFNGLSANGVIEMPIADGSWGACFGMFTDKYGVQ